MINSRTSLLLCSFACNALLAVLMGCSSSGGGKKIPGPGQGSVRKHKQYFKQAPPDAKNGKDQLKTIVATGNRMYKLEEVERKESLSEINYQNAVKFFNSRGITSQSDILAIERYTDATQRYLQLMNS